VKLDFFQRVAAFPVYRRGLNDFRNTNIEAVEKISHGSAGEGIDELFRSFVTKMSVFKVSHALVRRYVRTSLVYLAREKDDDADAIYGGVEVIPGRPRRSLRQRGTHGKRRPKTAVPVQRSLQLGQCINDVSVHLPDQADGEDE